MKIALNPLTSSVLLPSGLSEGMPATDEAIKKKKCYGSDSAALIILNEEM